MNDSRLSVSLLRQMYQPFYKKTPDPEFRTLSCLRLRESKEHPDEEGDFGAFMAVHLMNDGPVTIMLDSGI